MSAAVRSAPAAGRHADKATPGLASAVCLLNEMFSVQPTYMPCCVASSTADKQAVPVRGVCSTTRPMIMVRFVIVFIGKWCQRHRSYTGTVVRDVVRDRTGGK